MSYVFAIIKSAREYLVFLIPRRNICKSWNKFPGSFIAHSSYVAWICCWPMTSGPMAKEEIGRHFSSTPNDSTTNNWLRTCVPKETLFYRHIRNYKATLSLLYLLPKCLTKYSFCYDIAWLLQVDFEVFTYKFSLYSINVFAQFCLCPRQTQFTLQLQIQLSFTTSERVNFEFQTTIYAQRKYSLVPSLCHQSKAILWFKRNISILMVIPEALVKILLQLRRRTWWILINIMK